MIDIIPAEHSFAQNVYCALLYTMMVCVGYTANMYPHSRDTYCHSVSTVALVFGLFISCLTFFANGDYFHYYSITQKITMLNPDQNIETFYQYLIFFVHKNYLLFRIIVWGPACILLYLTIKRFKINTNHAYFFLITCYCITFSYARASLGMAVFFYGLSYVYYPPSNNKWLKIIGIAIILCAPIFHKSMYLLIAIWTMSIFINLDRKAIIVYLILLPVCIIVAKLLIPYIVSNLIQDQMTLTKIGTYSQLARESQNWKGMLQNIIQYATYYLPLLFLVHKLTLKKTKPECPPVIYQLYKLIFAIIFVASVLYFIIPSNTVLFYRTLFMAMIPITITITYAVDHGIITFGKYRIVILCGMVYSFLFNIYSIIMIL